MSEDFYGRERQARGRPNVRFCLMNYPFWVYFPFLVRLAGSAAPYPPRLKASHGSVAGRFPGPGRRADLPGRLQNGRRLLANPVFDRRQWRGGRPPECGISRHVVVSDRY